MLKSRLPQIAAEIPLKIDRVGNVAAELVATGARAGVPVETGRLRDAIHVDRDGEIGDFAVIAGDTEVFYGHLVEFGTSQAPARPFMVPAAEVVRSKIHGIAKEVMRTL